MTSTPLFRTRNIFEASLFISLCFCFFISPVFAKRGITIDDLSAITDIKAMTVSPDGKYVAFQTMQANKDTNEFTLGWYIAPTTVNAKVKKLAEGKEVTPITLSTGTPSGEIMAHEIIWSPDSQWIYFIKRHKAEFQIWRSNIGNFGTEQLTHNAGDIQSFKISSDGSKILFTIGRTRAEIITLIEENRKRGFGQKSPPLYTLEYGTTNKPCTDGQKRLVFFPIAAKTCLLTNWIYDIKLDTEHPATMDAVSAFGNNKEQYGDTTSSLQGPLLDEVRQMEKVSPDGRSIAWIENVDIKIYKGFVPPMILSVLKDGKVIRCPVKVCVGQKGIGFRGLWWHPNGKEIIFQVIDGPHGSLSSFYSWTPANGNIRTILSNDDRFTDCQLIPTQLVCGYETWTSPKRIASIKLDSGKISTLVDVNSEFGDIEFSKIEKIFGEYDNGHKIYAHLVYPKGYKKGHKYPLVITNYHSSGFLRGATGNEQPIHVYAQNGIAVLSVSMRHFNIESLMKNDDIMELNIELHRDIIIQQLPSMVIEDMVKALEERGIIDPNRVGISGLSTGATITDMALLRKNYAAASTAYSNTASRIFHSPRRITSKIRNVIFSGKTFSLKGAQMRNKYSIDSNANRIDTPYLIQVADREYYSTILNYNALLEADKAVEMYVYPNEYHVKWQPTHKYLVYSRNLDWFNFWLRDVEDKDTKKVEQYTRWRKLRDMHQANLAKLKKD